MNIDPTFKNAIKSLTVLDEENLTAEDYRVLHSGYLAYLAQAVKAGTLPDHQRFRAILGVGRIIVMPRLFRFSVDYNHKLKDMIGKWERTPDGCPYGPWASDDITDKNFPVEGEGVVKYEGVLFHFEPSISSERAIKAMASEDTTNPWSAARIEHLIAFGTKFPQEQRGPSHTILGLGSVGKVRGEQSVPDLSNKVMASRSRTLSANFKFSHDWTVCTRFLAVRVAPAPKSCR